MNFKFDGKKVKADMTKQLGYAQAGATKFIEKAKNIDVKSGAQYVADASKAGGQTAKNMFNKSATGQKINAHGKGLVGGAKKAFNTGVSLAKKNPYIAGATAGVAAVTLIKNRKKNA